ncbi:MAG: AmmeMemoRadiSam system protein B [Candidatus Rokubacteria bacterium]|nr:AmmeMemoRadiSam system protein B [Candidatus Rokubacteria bacterium]
MSPVVESSDRPKLRPVEAFPLETDGRKVIGLRDPAGFTDSVLLLPLPLLDIVSLFDGDHTILDIQAAYVRRHGELLFRERVEEIIKMLDDHGFLDSPRFAEQRRQIEEEFRRSPSRPAIHAGKAYAGEAQALKDQIDAFFTPPDGPGPPGLASAPSLRAIIAPHVDFHRGGPVYAWAYREVAEKCAADLFVIFGTCHAGMADPFAVTLKDYDTPLGPALVDREFADAVALRWGGDLLGSELAHRGEHSIEFQAVFLRYLFGGRREFTIVPILCSFLHETLPRGDDPEADPRIPRFFDALGETVAGSGRTVCLVAGADLAHVGPRFGDAEPVTPALLRDVESEDRAMLEAVAAGDARGFYDSVAKDADSRRICGLSPIYTLLRCLGRATGRLLRYGQWPDPQGTVTFCSVAFTRPQAEASEETRTRAEGAPGPQAWVPGLPPNQAGR